MSHVLDGPETIHVCSLAAVPEMITRRRAGHLVTCLHGEGLLVTPPGIPAGRHLQLVMHDIDEEMDGYVAPSATHVSNLIDFVQRWDRSAPLLIHCYAGISRSTAAAFIALCVLNPETPELRIARALRNASPSATPNRRLVALGDEALGREGRMISAAASIGQGDIGLAAQFSIPIRIA